MKLLKWIASAALALAASQAAAVGSLADLTIIDRASGRALPVYWHEGRAWVAGQPGSEYALRIRNRGEALLAVVSVDGVNAVTGETADPQQSGYVMAPGRMFDVNGWRKSLSSTAAFYFTALPDSYAARTGRPDNVGVIGLALFRRKAPPPPPIVTAPLAREAPAAAPAANGAGSAARAESSADARRDAQPSSAEKIGTGHGRVESSPTRYVEFERATRDPAETIAIWYDSAANLMARGIMPRPPIARPVFPRPFPGFVADPPA